MESQIDIIEFLNTCLLPNKSFLLKVVSTFKQSQKQHQRRVLRRWIQLVQELLQSVIVLWIENAIENIVVTRS